MLEAAGFVRMVADQCLYRKGDGDDEIIVGLWCDDIVVLTHKERTDLRQDFDELLKSVFVMSHGRKGRQSTFSISTSIGTGQTVP